MQTPVHFRGIVLGPSGFAAEGREWLTALERAGYAPSLEGAALGPDSCALSPLHDALIRRCAARPLRPDGITFHHLLVPHFEPDPRTRGGVLSTTFETESLPAGWAESIGRAARVIVRTEWNRDTFARGGVAPERIDVIPPPIALGTPVARPARRSPPFRWLSMFDWTLRKGHDVLLAACARAFEPGEAELVIKTQPKPGRDLRAEADAVAPGRVRVLASTLDDPTPLYAEADGFVLASRGEAWGRPVAEAMLAELPVVATQATALQTLLCSEVVGYPVASTEAAVSAAAAAETPCFAGQNWHEPNLDHLVSRLREVMRNPIAAAARGRAARRHVLQLCDPAKIDGLLRATIESTRSPRAMVAHE